MTAMFNGCSFVENSHLEMEIDQWQELYWPALVAPEHDNISASGASNTRIFRTTVDYLYTHDPHTVIIGWTGLDREELPCANGDRMRLRADCTSFENDQDSQVGRQFHETWYRDNHNDWLSFEQLLRYILIVQDLCRGRGIQFWMFNAFWHNYIAYPSQPLEFNFNVVEQKHFNKHLQDLHHVKSLIAQIDFEQWIWPAKSTLSQWAQHQGLEFESGGHPALSAQRPIADYVISRIQRPVLIN